MKTKKNHKKLTKKLIQRKKIKKKRKTKHIIKRNKKYNKTIKYLGSGPLDNLAKKSARLLPKLKNVTATSLSVIPGETNSQDYSKYYSDEQNYKYKYNQDPSSRYKNQNKENVDKINIFTHYLQEENKNDKLKQDNKAKLILNEAYIPSEKNKSLYSLMLSTREKENLKNQIYYDDQLKNTIENKIQDVNLKEKIISYNNQTKETDDVGFIGWSQAALLTNFNLSAPTLNAVIENTARCVAISKSIVVGAYNVGHYGVEKSFVLTHRIIPLGIKTGYGLMNWGLVKSVSALINMGYSKDIDWKDAKNLENYNTTLFSTLNDVFDVVLKDLIKKTDCKGTMSEILGQIVNKNTIEQLETRLEREREKNKGLDELLNISNEYCNKIVPAISSAIKVNSKDLKPQVYQILTEYNDSAFPLFKNVLWNILLERFNEISSNIEFESGDSPLDFKLETRISKEKELELKKSFNEIFNKTSLISAVKAITEEITSAYDIYIKVDKEKVHKKVKEYVKNTPNQEITNQETEVKKNLEDDLKKKVSIEDLYKNTLPSLVKLTILWNKEIFELGYDEYNSTVCLFNVLDLRINTLLKEVCEIHAKHLVGTIIPNEACNERTNKIAALLYDEPITKISNEDIEYSKDIMKRMLINIILYLLKENLLNNLKDNILFNTFTEGYLFLSISEINVEPELLID